MKAIRNGLIFSIPALLLGSMAEVFRSFPLALSIYSDYLHTPQAAEFMRIFTFFNEATVRLSPMFFLVGVSYSLADSFSQSSIVGFGRYKSFLAVIISLTVFIIFSFIKIDSIFLFNGTTTSSFWAIVIGLAATKVFFVLSDIPQLKINLYGDTINPIAPKVFETMIPALLTITLFAVLKVIIYSTGFNFGPWFLNYTSVKLISLLSTDLPSALLFVTIKSFYWFIAVSGDFILSSVTQMLYVVNPSKQIISLDFFHLFVNHGGDSGTLSFVIAALFMRKRSSSNRLAKIAVFPSFFNINELIIYGLPIVVSPIFMIPFFITPLVSTIIAYFAINIGLVPLPYINTPWTMPLFLSGYLATDGSFAASLLQLITVSVGVLIYYPFILMEENLRAVNFENNKKSLIDTSQNRFMLKDHYFTHQKDAMGGTARALCADLRMALRKDDLYLQYQPKIIYDQKKIMGFEALIRWHHPEYGLIPPPVIVALAEEGGFLSEMGLWVARNAARQQHEWRVAGLTDLTMAINLSAKELHDKNIARKIHRILKKMDIPVNLFEIEITENIELSINEQVSGTLNAFKSYGIPLAIDDFGMGHSSAVYLKRFRTNTLKIDRSISFDVVNDNRLAAILSSVLAICHRLNTLVVVEFVDNKEQLDFLLGLGCNIFQGYLFSKPLNPDDALLYVEKTMETGELQYGL